MDDWRQAGAAELGRAIGDGRLDPRELAERFIEAIESHPDAALIYARATPARARIEAEAARARRDSGNRAGPLDGVPISWKDNFDTEGAAAEAGSRLLAGRVPLRDAAALTKATQAGLICLGKTHLTELAFSGLGLNPMTATPPNRYDRRRAPGGSSSGAAVSTAFGLAAAGIGSDTGGSVRVPAAWNGLVGIKTEIGAVSREGVVPLSPVFDTPGPLAKTVEDAALLLDALTGRNRPAPQAETPARLTIPETLVMDDLDPEVAAGFDDAMGLLSGAGIEIARAAVPEIGESAELLANRGGVLANDVWRQWGETIEANPDAMFHRIEVRFRGCAGFAESDEAHSREVQARLRDRIGARIAERGMLVMPTAPILPPFLSRLWRDDDYFAARNQLALRNTRQANLLDLTSITLPSRTPMVGVMLFAGTGEADRLIAAGRALEPILAG